MVALSIVIAGEGAFGGLFVGQHCADRHVVAVFGDDAGNDIRINAGEVVVIVGLLIGLRAVWVSGRRVDASFLHETSVRSPTVARRLCVIVPADRPGERRRQYRVKLDIVDSHRIAATIGAEADAFQSQDIIESRTNLCIHTGHRECRRAISNA